MIKSLQEQTKHWYAPDIGAVELLTATFVTHTFPRHVHEGYAIGVIEHGSEQFYYRGGNHVAPAGTVVVIHPDEVHTGQAYGRHGWIYRMLYPAAELVQQVVTELGQQPHSYPYFPQPVLHDDYLAGLMRQLHHTLEQSNCTLERETLFTKTVAQLILRHATNRPTMSRLSTAPQAIRQVRDYLETRFAENISLTDLANQVNFSPFYLARLFQQTVGLPPHAYLTQVRVIKAKQFLRRGQSLAQVAADTGFVDQSHLTRHFKRIVGVPPGQYSQSFSLGKLL